ncbi:adhesion G protein-coupled receptor F5-like [Megalobrama amblycephala]|uniref:adhesion G protein-coupled receptor F5-like n=1 Tax=Megalobrama amblycephala TaxID=75352 RepID=UPI0020145500|nr:adhesion G protein-coupled receptor F5-like [Megalobrama amblycephala]
MAKVTGKILKYIGVIMAILLNVETLNFSEISMDLQFSYTDEPVHHIRRRSADPVEYIMVVEMNVSETVAINKIRSSVTTVTLPVQVDNGTEITALNISTVCSFNETQYQCKCEDLFVWPNDTCHSYKACDDINDGSCTCINALPVDGQFCEDIDECLVSPSVCGPNSTCTNQMGSYSCLCSNGFTATNSSLHISINNTCTDIDECLVSPSVCGPNSTCTNQMGSYSCFCSNGFTATNSSLPISVNNTCTDIDECLVSPSVCGPNSTCTNQMGSYSCLCSNGFTATNSSLHISINNTCTDIDECLVSPSVCGPNSTCTNQMGSYSCFCSNGFTATNSSLPISVNNTCTDIDECLVSPSVCGPNSTCTNQMGSYSCFCSNGFTATNSSLPISVNNTCTDIDECLVSPSVCGPNSTCTNQMGSYSCLCSNGFTATNSSLHISINNTCTDIDECLVSPSVCGPNSTCTNQMGSYSCFCSNGFTATNSSLPISVNNTCTDIDECLVSPSVCGPNSTCTNQMGSYSCLCSNGFTATNSSLHISINNTCTDIDECLVSPSVCGPNSTCTNQMGSYSCFCSNGFTATNSSLPISVNNTCTDIDECLVSPSVCGPNSTCTNQMGSYSCLCSNGFTATNSSLHISINNTCTDIDECLVSPSVCGPNSTCTNQMGSYSCFCSNGFTATNSSLPISVNNTCTAITAPSAPSTPSTTVIGMSMTIDQTFDISLTDPTSENYKYLYGKIAPVIESTYSSKLVGYIPFSAKPTGVRPGSVIADYTISATSNNLDFTAAHSALPESLKKEGIVLAENAFSRSEQTDFTTGHLYPLQKLDLNCIQPDFAKGPIKWIVNNKDPALDNTRYTLSNSNSILTVKNTSESDSGRYSCIIQTNTIPYIQWQNIIIRRPTIIVGDENRVFPCKDSTVQLRCSVDAGYNVEWVLNGAVQTSVPASGSDIILNHPTKSGDCKEETFTCRLKDLPQLLAYSYSWSRVTVKTSTENYDCRDEEIGLGKTNDEKTAICRTGFKGTITYRCESRGWTPVQDNCVLEVIFNLKNTVETLLVVEIPGFMANLSSATSQNNVNITQSPSTVQTIVDILFKIADLSQATSINSIVMENYLKTVNIIVSGNVSDTWNTLNKGNTTEKPSIRLLRSIEKISDRLKDEFKINETSIQLNRTTIQNSFSITSTLPNSTTEIVIPQVPNVTTVTIIIFTTLDNVLPARTSNINDTNNSVRINGDVVVVKVNQAINNISFAFDITNQSLGNPQCVFWNFSLDRWDSTGCEVKPSVNETGKITCECDHTTSFSILMSPFSIDNKTLAYITYIGVAISMASLILCLIIETIVWKSVTRKDDFTRNSYTSYMRHVFMVNIAVSLLIANICFIIGAAITDKEQQTSVGRCSPAVFFMHFFYLALFFWMLISALFLFYRTVMVLSQMSRFRMMAIAFIVGYGAPLLIAVITVASTAGPQKYISQKACWLNWDESKALLAFVIPALTIVAINLVVLIVVLYKMLRRGVGAATQPENKHALMVIARCVAILTPIFGLTWGFGIGTMVSPDYGVHVVFALLNSLQGFFILVFGTLLDRGVRKALAERNFISSSHTTSTSAGPSSSSRQDLLRRNGYNISAATSSNISSASNT